MTVDISDWIREVKEQPGATGIGMILAHQGIVHGTSRSGTPVRGMELAGDIRDNVFAALQRLVSLIKNEVVSESEIR